MKNSPGMQATFGPGLHEETHTVGLIMSLTLVCVLVGLSILGERGINLWTCTGLYLY